ncbi:hypothetical protein J1777_09030 [Comamonas denitrificans]|jgi:hypothetical protein|uniref:Uncharacterized protein n=1 Tax=Comamonas denitrificans TaxID=117506 RepID=A0A939KDT0_9BURK|nr:MULTISPECIES: hypothetical protein [Comamonadaceae]MBO1249961.1 hypothetical protein [Comamonas denitrificans]MDA8451134.1 hypothetical protein [Acidovorax sp. GBBC 3297]MDA8460579.1 hypothetical protein [Acidovorax sp. GBBC 3333]MDA8470649.1 hypothetical protein [Acidovorax sp. GBBC 3299]
MARPSKLESLASSRLQNLISGGLDCLPFVAAWRLSTAAALLYNKLEKLS